MKRRATKCTDAFMILLKCNDDGSECLSEAGVDLVGFIGCPESAAGLYAPGGYRRTHERHCTSQWATDLHPRWVLQAANNHLVCFLSSLRLVFKRVVRAVSGPWPRIRSSYCECKGLFRALK